MKGRSFSEEQIIGILNEHKSGIPVAELCRKRGVSDAMVIIGGLLTSTVLSLVVIPVIFTFVDDLRKLPGWLASVRRR